VHDGNTQPPPAAVPLVREGAFALNLAALSLDHPTSEVEAESILGTAGIAPSNGWIADYPVTPDIIGGAAGLDCLCGTGPDDFNGSRFGTEAFGQWSGGC
jgi:hypothetical protein